VLLDHNLADGRGHHLAVADRLAGAAAAAGRTIHLLVHRDLPTDRIHPATTVTPLFPETSYDAMARGERRHDLAPGLVAALDRAMADGLLADATLLLPSADGHGVRAVASRLPQLVAGGTTVHLATPYLPDSMPGSRAGPGVDGSLRALAQHQEQGRRLFLWAETPRLAEFLGAAYGAPVGWLPVPLPAWSTDMPPAADPFRLAFLGTARAEKGFALLPALVAAIRHATGGAVRFEVQACPPASGIHPTCAAALAALERMPEVRLHPGVLDEADYAALIARSDGILAPYRPGSYALRGSGIAAEALACGRFLLTSTDTELAREAPAGLLLAAREPAGWAALLPPLLAELPARRHRARAAAARFRRGRSAAEVLDRLFAREGMAPLLTRAGAGAAPLPSLIDLPVR
jgi:hypothetical protein